jgi:hypothetical protein
MLLALGSHPHTGVSREAGALCGVELVDGNEDALGRTRQQVVEINTLSDVLLGDLVRESDVRLHELMTGVVAVVGLGLRNQLDLLGFSEDDGSGGE